MRAKTSHIFLAAFFFFLFFGCSTKKNTSLSRNYQSLNTRFNVYFNGNESYKEGILKINKSHVDDYSDILLMYPISYHANASAATSDMDRAIDKSKKAIKKRSIRKKPKKNFKKLKDPKYQAFLNQEEYNPMIDDVWILMGKAEFHKAEFLASVGTFTYITHHFSSNKEVLSEAMLWLARSYAEMGWYYEAEDVLNKINRDDFAKNQTSFFAAVTADLLLKEKHYNDAIPFLKLAIEGEKDNRQKERFEYILGQLYQQKGDNDQAFLMYKSVAKSNPPFEMAFNARIKQSECYIGSDKQEMLKMLQKMAKDSKNSDYLDQIYCAIANVYIQEKDTTSAIKNYKLSIEKSTRNGYEKAQSLILLGDLYYKQEKYLKAEPYYSEAALLMNPQSADFVRVNNLAQYLSELNSNYQTVALQDSLQAMSKLPEKEKLEKINSIIKQVTADEAAAKKKEEEEKRLAESSFGGANLSSFNNTTTNMVMALGDNRSSSFYFYNTQLLAAGKVDFQKRWGTRKLEDNWRRQIKTQIPTSDSNQDFADEKSQGDNKDGKTDEKKLDDNKNPDFYLKQLFSTPEQFENSNEEIAASLYNIGYIYNDNIHNTAKAIEAFEELERRFPTNEELPEAYFYMYQTYNKLGEKKKADFYRKKLISQFPNNRYARILSQPDYEAKLFKMNAEQDSLYEQTYYAYLSSNYQKVNANYFYMDKNYPASYLMPKFMLLSSLTKAKTSTQEVFKKSLDELIEKYPESDVVSMAKDLLALMAQGKESKMGNSHGGLITLREKESESKIAQTSDGKALQFKIDAQERHFFVIYIPAGSLDVNKLQYNIAAYNFTKFLIKDFDIELRKIDDTNIILIKNLESLDEALWYKSGVLADNYLSGEINNNGLTNFVISESNYNLLVSSFTFKDYQKFFNEKIAKNPKQYILEGTNQGVKIQPKVETVIPVAKTEQTVVTPKTVEPVSVKTEPQETANVVVPAEEVQVTKPEEPVVVNKAEPKKELTRFRGLYTFDEQAKHYFAFYIVSGTFDFPVLKAALDKYNAENYPLLNMQVSLTNSGKQKVILVSMFPDFISSKSYLMNIIKNRNLFTPGLQQAQYRNLIITEENLATLNKIGTISVYIDFMKEVLLK